MSCEPTYRRLLSGKHLKIHEASGALEGVVPWQEF